MSVGRNSLTHRAPHESLLKIIIELGHKLSNLIQRLIRSQARALAKRIVRQRDLAQLRARFGRIFSTFDPQDVIENQQDTVTKGLWTGGIGNLNNMFTSNINKNVGFIMFYLVNNLQNYYINY